MRLLVGIGTVVVVLALVVAGLVVRRDDDHGYEVRAIFDNAGFVIPGEEVKVAGVRVGTIKSLDVTPDFKAAVVLDITQPGYQDFRRDASCIVRPQSLIGERYVECTPTQPRAVDAPAPPSLRRIASGAGKGQYLLPVTNTQQTVDADLIADVMREPERERLSLILNELGTGLAGRGKDLNAVIERADPALAQTDRVLAILAGQDKVLDELATNADTVLAPLARSRAQVAGAVRNSGDVADATAARSAALKADLQKLPTFLDELKPTLVQLGALADQMTPVLTDVGAVAPQVSSAVQRLAPFSREAEPALQTLGAAGKTGIPALTDARPVLADLGTLAKELRPVGALSADVLESFQKTDGIERLMDFLLYSTTSINGFDQLGHYLRADLLVNQCSTYAVTPVAGCSSNFAPASDSSASATAVSASAASDDPQLQATAAALAQALAGETGTGATGGDGAAGDAGSGGAAAPDATVTATPTATPSPLPSVTATPRATATATPRATATPTAPPTPSSTPQGPGDALLDYLFGGDQ